MVASGIQTSQLAHGETPAAGSPSYRKARDVFFRQRQESSPPSCPGRFELKRAGMGSRKKSKNDAGTSRTRRRPRSAWEKGDARCPRRPRPSTRKKTAAQDEIVPYGDVFDVGGLSPLTEPPASPAADAAGSVLPPLELPPTAPLDMYTSDAHDCLAVEQELMEKRREYAAAEECAYTQEQQLKAHIARLERETLKLDEQLKGSQVMIFGLKRQLAEARSELAIRTGDLTQLRSWTTYNSEDCQRTHTHVVHCSFLINLL